MWVNDNVIVMKEHTVKKGKVKLRALCAGIIKKHLGQIGISDETSEFLVECENGDLIEVSEDYLKAV